MKYLISLFFIMLFGLTRAHLLESLLGLLRTQSDTGARYSRGTKEKRNVVVIMSDDLVSL